MNDVVVVDASLALKWVLIEEDSDAAKSLLSKWTAEGKGIIAPALFAYEVTNILYRQVITNKRTYEEASEGLTKLFSLGVELNFLLYENISTQAMKLAYSFKLPTTYDAHYLALSEEESCEYWTADIRLWNSVKGKANWVRLLSEYQP